MTFSGGYSGTTSQLTPAAGGVLYFPVANPGLSGTLDLANGGYVAGNRNAFGPATTLELDGGTLAASTTLTGSLSIANPITFGSNQRINIAASLAKVGATSLIQFSGPVSLANNSAYTFNDPAGMSIFSGVISGPGSVVCPHRRQPEQRLHQRAELRVSGDHRVQHLLGRHNLQ